MAIFLNQPVRALIAQAQSALGMSQRQLGESLGSSHRTAQRWAAGQSSPSVPMMCDLARLVHPRDPALAAKIASSASETLESLGLVTRAPAPVIPRDVARGAILAVAADAAHVTPSAARAGLLAAFRRARELRFEPAALEALLAEAAAGT